MKLDGLGSIDGGHETDDSSHEYIASHAVK